MKKTTFLAVTMCISALTTQAQEFNKTTRDKELDSTLCEVFVKDQFARIGLRKAIKENNVDSIIHYNTMMQTADEENQRIVFNLLDETGWPEDLSNDANKAIFLVIDHSDIESQKKYLNLVKLQSENGVISKSYYPTLLDRVLMKENQRQVYGTQTHMNMNKEEKVLYVWPVVNAENIDSLRNTVDLLPLAEYMEVMKEVIGCEVIFDNSLNPEDIKGKSNE